MAIRRTKRIAKACGRNFQSRPSSVWSLLQRIAFLYCSGIWMWWNESMNRPGGRDTYSKLYCAGEYPGALIKTRIQIQKTWGGAWTPTSRQLFQGPNFEEQDSNPSLLIINQLSFLEGPLCPPRFWVTSTHPSPSAHRPQGSLTPSTTEKGFSVSFQWGHSFFVSSSVKRKKVHCLSWGGSRMYFSYLNSCFFSNFPQAWDILPPFLRVPGLEQIIL